MQDELTTTYWHCDRCKRSGQVQHEVHAGVWEVYTLIQDTHYAATMGGCDERYYIRVSKQPITEEGTRR